jgi:hypothetical protein
MLSKWNNNILMHLGAYVYEYDFPSKKDLNILYKMYVRKDQADYGMLRITS